jgi:hypothetical protein
MESSFGMNKDIDALCTILEKMGADQPPARTGTAIDMQFPSI